MDPGGDPYNSSRPGGKDGGDFRRDSVLYSWCVALRMKLMQCDSKNPN